ncbi:MAG: hypothetical protein Q8Q46_02785 [Candidatus Giovannonibacteria bacterium]|nr:hypothetical protein [Candidatus Giovannonibacteria bacterium]
MADSITKKDLEQYQKVVIDAVDFKFQKIDSNFRSLEVHIDQRFEQLEKRMDSFDQKLEKLAITLDNFVKMMTDSKEEFVILKAEVDQIKSILQEKFGIKIAVQK